MIVRPIQGANDVALLVLYKIGGDHDPEGHSGLAHLVEHVYSTAAAGAEPARTADALFRRYPSGCNAQTGDRYTVFATVFPKGELEKELAEASARMSDLRLSSGDLDREVPRLLDEVANMFGRIPALGAVNNARELVRPSPRAGRKGGLPDHIRAITLDEVRSYWKRYYKPANAIVVVAGAVDEGAARRAVTAHFAKVPAGEPVPPPGEPGASRAGTVRELAVKPLQPQAEPVACLAYAGPGAGERVLCAVSRDRRPAVRGFWPVRRPARSDDDLLPAARRSGRPGHRRGARSRESPERGPLARLEKLVADAVAPGIRQDERASTRQMFGFLLGTSDLPDFALARNPYGLALSLARREQLGLDSVKLGRALDALTEAELRRAAAEFLAPARDGAAIVSPRN